MSSNWFNNPQQTRKWLVSCAIEGICVIYPVVADCEATAKRYAEQWALTLGKKFHISSCAESADSVE